VIIKSKSNYNNVPSNLINTKIEKYILGLLINSFKIRMNLQKNKTNGLAIKKRKV